MQFHHDQSNEEGVSGNESKMSCLQFRSLNSSKFCYCFVFFLMVYLNMSNVHRHIWKSFIPFFLKSKFLMLIMFFICRQALFSKMSVFEKGIQQTSKILISAGREVIKSKD